MRANLHAHVEHYELVEMHHPVHGSVKVNGTQTLDFASRGYKRGAPLPKDPDSSVDAPSNESKTPKAEKKVRAPRVPKAKKEALQAPETAETKNEVKVKADEKPKAE